MAVCPAWKKAALFGLVFLTLPQLIIPFAVATNRQTMNYQPISGPLTNPLMGWAPWATIKESKQPHTLVYADLTWREFEPQRGVYDFAGFEKKNQLDRWRAENKRVVFRFVCDRPGSQDHLDIPDWLYEAIHGSGDRYHTDYGRGFSPDYANPTFMQFHKEAIQALGNRYGKDGFFAYIELGSLGHWGEWHIQTGAGLRPMPAEEVRDAYVQQYREAFPGTFLLMRRPFTIARQLNLGLYNDMTADLASTQQWLDWIDNGGRYDQTGEENALAAMPSAWKTAPMGGEQSPELSQQAVYDTNLTQTVQLLEQSHVTFIGPHGPYDVDPRSPFQPGIDQVMGRIGYRIYVQQVQMPGWMLSIRGLPMIVSVTFANDGIAPIYYPWPGQFYVFDQDGQVRVTYQPNMDIRKVVPGSPYRVTFALPLNNLQGGKFTLGFAILDPVNDTPAVRLAMTNPRSDLIQELGTFEVVRLGLFNRR